jgi:hypothetical protein
MNTVTVQIKNVEKRGLSCIFCILWHLFKIKLHFYIDIKFSFLKYLIIIFSRDSSVRFFVKSDFVKKY